MPRPALAIFALVVMLLVAATSASAQDRRLGDDFTTQEEVHRRNQIRPSDPSQLDATMSLAGPARCSFGHTGSIAPGQSGQTDDPAPADSVTVNELPNTGTGTTGPWQRVAPSPDRREPFSSPRGRGYRNFGKKKAAGYGYPAACNPINADPIKFVHCNCRAQVSSISGSWISEADSAAGDEHLS